MFLVVIIAMFFVVFIAVLPTVRISMNGDAVKAFLVCIGRTHVAPITCLRGTKYVRLTQSVGIHQSP